MTHKTTRLQAATVEVVIIAVTQSGNIKWGNGCCSKFYERGYPVEIPDKNVPRQWRYMGDLIREIFRQAWIVVSTFLGSHGYALAVI